MVWRSSLTCWVTLKQLPRLYSLEVPRVLLKSETGLLA